MRRKIERKGLRGHESSWTRFRQAAIASHVIETHWIKVWKLEVGVHGACGLLSRWHGYAG